MKNKNIKENINNFINTLKKVSPVPEKRVDHGLIVIENKDISFDDIQKNIDAIFCPDAKNYIKFVNKLLKANDTNKKLLVAIKETINPKIISALKEISINQSINLENFNNKDVFNKKLNKDLRIIFVSKRSIIENDLEYEFLYNLFGPILSI